MARVLVTRAAEDAPVLAHALAVAGYEPVVVPVLERRWLPFAVADLAAERPEADWVVVTSAVAAEIVAVGAPGAWRSARWAAVGPSTADRLGALGYTPERVPDKATARDLVAAMGDLTGQVVVYPRADLAPPATAEGLREAGAEVLDVVAYENVAPAGYEERLRRMLPVAATTLLSGSAAERVAEALPAAERPGLGLVVVIGPSTARAAERAGLTVHAEAQPHSVAGVVATLQRRVRR
ncbi:MAG: uroporphyrinogen-III synthase [Myxococcota bacterium]